MDLMTLAAKIELDDKSFVKGVGNAEKMGKQLAGKMSAMTVAVGNLAADMIKKGVSAISGVVNGAIDNYANYQQLIGGVETLFKNSANTVSKYAQQSFKTTGLSANQYMETVTSFSASLIKGLQGDTDTAAEMANMAVTDMADNANKMGTDMASIQNAYQGFAKQNFTMLDNLKLGYGGTAGEMVRLINDSGILEKEIKDLDGITFDQLVKAIHVIQEQMGITGTTAKEASDTISGSKASLKAAWEDMLSAVGGEGDQTRLDQTFENFKTSFSTYMENFIPTLVETITNSGGLVTAIADSIAALPKDLLTKIGEAGLDAGADMVSGVSKITNWLIDSLINVFSAASIDNSSAARLGEAIGDFLGTAISKIVTNAGTIFTGIFNLGIGLAEGLADGLFKGLFGEDAEVDKIAKAMEGTISDAELSATKSGALLDYMRTLKESYGDAVQGTTAWKEALKELEQYIPGAGNVFKNFGRDVDGAFESLERTANKMRETAINSALWSALSESYGLLARQNIEYRKQEARYERNKFIVDNTPDKIRESIMETAGRKAEEYYNSTHDEQGNQTGMFDENMYLDWVNFSKGLDAMGESLEGLGLDELKGIVDQLGDEGLTKSIQDELQTIAEAKTEMEAAKKEMDAASKEIEATEKNIEDVKVAVSKSATDLNTAFGTSATGIDEGGGAVTSALQGVADGISSIKIPSVSILNPFSYMPRAVGIDNVPFDGFRTELHRGEMVLTKGEANKYRGGDGSAAVVGAIQGMRNDLQNMQLVVGQNTFGRTVVDYSGRRMSNYIGQAESRYSSGYGT